MKKYLIFVFLLCIGLVSSSVSDIDLVLSTEFYGQDQNFEGYFNINSDVDNFFGLDEKVDIKIVDCGSENTPSQEYSIYTLLNNSGLFWGDQYVYTMSDGIYSIYLESSEEVYAFNTEYPVSFLNFSVSGNGGPTFIDIGIDGVKDWQYIGDTTSWSNIIYPLGFEYNIGDVVVDNYLSESQDACNDLVINFNEFLDELKLKIGAVARREAEGGDLEVVLSTGESCVLDNPIDNWDDITSEDQWVDLSCTINLDVSEFNDNSLIVGICLSPTNNNFIVPRYHTSEGDYYFINLRKANYEEDLSSEKRQISSIKLVDSINNYRYEHGCTSDEDCLIPFSLSIGFGNVMFEDLELIHGSIIGNTIYNVLIEADEVSLTGLNIPLSGFSNFKTPVNEVGNCSLKVSFQGEFDKKTFKTGSSPTALITIDSLYFVQNELIIFSAQDSFASNGKDIIGYFWDFGDGSNSTLPFPSHNYIEEGEYFVKLTVIDSEGISSSVENTIHVVDLENHLNFELPIAIVKLESAFSFFDQLDSNSKIFADLIGADSLLFSTNLSLEDLYETFISTKLDLNITDTVRNTIYSQIATNMHSITSITPLSVSVIDSVNIIDMKLTSPEDIFNFNNVQNFEYYKNNIYNFNKNKVTTDSEFDLLKLKYIEGESNYLLVKKTVNVDGGLNNVLVEDLRNYELDSFYGNGIKNNLGSVEWDLTGDSIFLTYAIGSTDLNFINSIVYTAIEAGGVIDYNYDCDTGDCDFSYCGDGYCDIFSYSGIDELDEYNLNYCPADCGGIFPTGWFIFLFILLVLGVIYINFYRGPGNFQYLANLLSYRLFKRKLFITGKDRINLSRYIKGALARGFNEVQIRTALMRRGWNKKQLDIIFKDIRNI